MKTFLPILTFAGWSLLAVGYSGQAWGEALPEALKKIQGVGKGGRGHGEAAAAWKQLAQAGPTQLPLLLGAMDSGNELAVNWIRGAVETIVDRELKAGRVLPVADLADFLMENGHHPRARRLAFELISRAAPQAADQLIPGLLHDPSVELRREPVQRLMDRAAAFQKGGEAASAVVVYRQALQAARDVDQIEAAAAELRKLGREVDLPRQFGFLMEWKVAGPFDNTAGSGFETVFPPEKGIDLAANYAGKNGMVSWKDLISKHDLGVVDVNTVCGMLKEVTAYGYAEFHSPTARAVELRLGCKNAWKIWVNGEFLFGRDEYHRGAQIDQYRLPCQLREGRNQIVVKLCQNEQQEDWTREWEFQLRVCDETGAAILSTDRLVKAAAKR